MPFTTVSVSVSGVSSSSSLLMFVVKGRFTVERRVWQQQCCRQSGKLQQISEVAVTQSTPQASPIQTPHHHYHCTLPADNAEDWITGWIPPWVTWCSTNRKTFFFSSQIWLPRAFAHSLSVLPHSACPSIFVCSPLWLTRPVSCLCHATIKPISCEGCDPPCSYLLPCSPFKKRLKSELSLVPTAE